MDTFTLNNFDEEKQKNGYIVEFDFLTEYVDTSAAVTDDRFTTKPPARELLATDCTQKSPVPRKQW